MQSIITPTAATLGATITGVDLANLDEGEWKAIEAAFHEFAVLVFPDQHLSDEAQAGFGGRFGDIEYLRPNQAVIAVSNVREDGTLHAPKAHRTQVLRGNEGWHTDSSYMPLAAKASVLSAHIIPSEGGQTEWADTRAAYDALDDETKGRVADLNAFHSLFRSQSKIGHTAKPSDEYGFHREEPPLRPLVKVHPVTGRKSLFIGRHAYGIPGLDEAESESLLQNLTTFACQAPRTHMHQWRPGDVVIWDNRCVLHRARPYDFAEARVLKHTRVAGDPNTEIALNTTLRSNEQVRR